MANNRMWLVYKPTGDRALIAKSFNRGWKQYDGPRNHPFYSVRELLKIYGQDDNTYFEIEYETKES